jgi:SAM-dependent methyltransferase
VWYHFESVSDIESQSPPRGVVVDLGCGEGLLLNQIKSRRTLIGIDVSRDCLRQVIADGSAQFCIMSGAENVPLRDNVVDVVVSHQVIEHVADQSRAISEASRILRPDGLLIASTPVKGLLGRFVARSRNGRGERVLSPDHVSEYKSEAEIVDSFARQSGGVLTPVKVMRKSVKVPASRMIPWLYNKGYVGPLLPAFLYYSDVYVVFRKNSTTEATKKWTNKYQA